MWTVSDVHALAFNSAGGLDLIFHWLSHSPPPAVSRSIVFLFENKAVYTHFIEKYLTKALVRIMNLLLDQKDDAVLYSILNLVKRFFQSGILKTTRLDRLSIENLKKFIAQLERRSSASMTEVLSRRSSRQATAIPVVEVAKGPTSLILPTTSHSKKSTAENQTDIFKEARFSNNVESKDDPGPSKKVLKNLAIEILRAAEHDFGLSAFQLPHHMFILPV
ncbi:hypothetical protein BJ742DRAFT_434126 [Cladochytrium replicatum]|nr:hypothetical protein BJ742DRAFT_434126 [Cladochytrium replicatum]